MLSGSIIIIFIVIIWATIYTVSYARWTWKEANRVGAVALFILALIVLTLPIYALYFRY
jgi:hypothetical protein